MFVTVTILASVFTGAAAITYLIGAFVAHLRVARANWSVRSHCDVSAALSA